MKKFVSMAMALFMAMCFVSTSAFAASNPTLTITKANGYDISSIGNIKRSESYNCDEEYFESNEPTIWWKANRNLKWPEVCSIYENVSKEFYPEDNWGNGYGTKAVKFTTGVRGGNRVNLQPIIYNDDAESKNAGKVIAKSKNTATFEHYKKVKNIKLTETKTGDIKVTWTDPNQNKSQSRDIKYKIKVGYKGNEDEIYYVPMAEKTYYVDVKNNKKEVKSYTIKRKLFKKYVKKGKKLGVVIVPFTKSGSLEKNNLVRAVGDCTYKTIKLTK